MGCTVSTHVRPTTTALRSSPSPPISPVGTKPVDGSLPSDIEAHNPEKRELRCGDVPNPTPWHSHSCSPPTLLSRRFCMRVDFTPFSFAQNECCGERVRPGRRRNIVTGCPISAHCLSYTLNGMAFCVDSTLRVALTIFSHKRRRFPPIHPPLLCRELGDQTTRVLPVVRCLVPRWVSPLPATSWCNA
jgi:hypothetical protein